MPQTAISTKIHESFNIHGHFCSKFTFDPVFTIYHFSDIVYFILRQIIRLFVQINLELSQYTL